MSRKRFVRDQKYVNPVQALIDPVITEIFVHEKKHLNSFLHDIVRDNHEMGGSLECFIYGGKIYYIGQYRFIRGKEVKHLDSSLSDRVDLYDELLAKLETDIRRIKNSLSVVFAKCDTIQNIRDVLPEGIISFIPELKSMERMNPEGFVLQEHPVLLKQFQETVDIILYYQANRLVYS